MVMANRKTNNMALASCDGEVDMASCSCVGAPLQAESMSAVDGQNIA